MSKKTKAREFSSPKIQELNNKITYLQLEQTKTKMLIAIQITELMTAKGLNKSQLAKTLNKNPSEITKWLSGTHNFTIDLLTQIASALDVEVAALLKSKKNQISQEKNINYNTGIRSKYKPNIPSSNIPKCLIFNVKC